jgi:DNA-binding protein YbaB
MFDKFKAMGAIAGLMGKKGEIKAAVERVKDKLARATLTGTGGGGAVKALVSGQMKVLSIELSPALAAGIATDNRTRELAGDLIAQAVNDGLAQAQTLVKDSIAAEAQVLGLPDLGGLEGLAS